MLDLALLRERLEDVVRARLGRADEDQMPLVRMPGPWLARGADVERRPFAAALVTLGLAAAYAVSSATLSDFSDFDVRTAAPFGLVFLAACGPLPTRLAVITLAGALVTLSNRGPSFAFPYAYFEFDARVVGALGLVFLLLLFFRPFAALLARVQVDTPGGGGRGAETDHGFKLTFAGALIALALAATHASSADAFSDFDTMTVAAFGVTVNAALVLLLLFRTAAAALLVVIALAGGFFTLALAVSHAFSADARTVATALGVTANAALLSGALLLLCRIPANALLALVAAVGVTTAHGVFTDLWATEPAVVLLLGAMSGFALFVAFGVIEDRPRAGAGLAAAAVAALATMVTGHSDPRFDSAVSGDVSNIRGVSLSRTPNLYFISFDSLVPRALLKKYFDVDGTGFHTLFDAKFRRFPNLFANANSTKRSLNTVLALDPQVYNSQRAAGRDPGMFSGRSPSPLLGILRENGYETSTLFDNSYLGKRKGPWVDNYVYFQNRTLCGLLDEEIRPWAFWGYCRWFRRAGSHFPPFLERITSVDAGGEPQFTMAHLYIPGHASHRYGDAAAFERYRARYLRRIETAAGYLDRIVRHVEEDPGAILLLYSDHGMWLSQGMGFDDDPEFFVQDRYGVLGGVFPPEACASWFDAAAAPGWMTLLDAVHAVLSCLSGGESALVEPRTYMIDIRGRPATRPPSGRSEEAARHADFADFLYE